MTRALVTQMQSALEGVLKAHRIQESRTLPTPFSEANAKVDAIKYAVGDAEKAITAAREYLAAEPSGERADSAQWLREFADMEFSYYSREATQLRKAADMLEADAQPKQVTCQIYGHVVGACVECNTHIEAQQAKRVPLSDAAIWKSDAIMAANSGYGATFQSLRDVIKAVEAHHGITPADDEPEDLYALALKADNWGQP